MSPPSNKSSNSSTKATSRQADQTKIVIFRLPSSALSRYPAGESKANPITHSVDDGTSSSTPRPREKNDDETGTPTKAVNGTDNKEANGTKAGLKRSSSTQDGPARPGPKKKARITDSGAERLTAPTKGRPVGGNAGHKGGPRNNTGAINAGLRALDRTGKPCRRWQRNGLALKSFTGVNWSLDKWNAPRGSATSFPGDVKSDSSSAGLADVPVQSSALASESSHTGDNTPAINGMTNGMHSSPAPASVQA